MVDLREQQLVNTIKLQPGSILAGAALVNDSIAYVANSNLNTITRVDLTTGDTASLAVGNTPEQMRLANRPDTTQTDDMKRAEGRLALAGVKKNEPRELQNPIAPEESLTSRSIRGC